MTVIDVFLSGRLVGVFAGDVPSYVFNGTYTWRLRTWTKKS
jgi:hypothetical protein